MRHQMEYRYPSLFNDNLAFKTREETKTYDTEEAARILSCQSKDDIIAAATLTHGELRKALIFLGHVADEYRPEGSL